MITDNFLTGLAKFSAGESYDIPAYLTVSSDSDVTAAASTTSLLGEFGSRFSLAFDRTDDTVKYSAVRSGAIVGSSGDVLTAVALFPESTGSGCQLITVLPSLTQTSSFDIDFNMEVTFRRR